MLELAILGVLKEQELHGYELKKRLTDALGPFSSVSFGSLYPALARLEAAGAVRPSTRPWPPAAEPSPAPAVPMTGSIAGEAAAFRARRAAAAPARASPAPPAPARSTPSPTGASPVRGAARHRLGQR